MIDGRDEIADPRLTTAWTCHQRFCTAHYPYWLGSRHAVRETIEQIAEQFGVMHTLVMAHQLRVVIYRPGTRYDMNASVEDPEEMAQRWGLIRSSAGHYYLFKSEEDAVIARLLVG